MAESLGAWIVIFAYITLHRESISTMSGRRGDTAANFLVGCGASQVMDVPTGPGARREMALHYQIRMAESYVGKDRRS